MALFNIETESGLVHTGSNRSRPNSLLFPREVSETMIAVLPLIQVLYTKTQNHLNSKYAVFAKLQDRF